ncbi:hypothetical protein M2282_006079 [Variovorax boronicumulans]|uniref:hypothetical protein n=1 Tax=Variovorax boronicumulans TaxID=436515 RepID=UPI0024762BC8|nr:hypothetical protein [Variovorax boronicumulans]MDH6170899.1 hypothetical protein [Variovorax boronicumulans]
MPDLSIQFLAKAAVLAFIALFVVLIALSLFRGGTWKLKLFYVTVTVLAFISPKIPDFFPNRDFEKKYAKAKAVFDERCKTAGERIYRTVDDVEGVLLLNVRPAANTSVDGADPNWPDAGLPNEPGGKNYIANFLQWEHHQDKRSPRGYLNQDPSDLPGYRYVDAKDKDGVVWRYTLAKRDEPSYPFPTKTEVKDQPARYAVSFTNLIDPEDRKLWVAGTTVSVTDTQTGEILAQATWYSFDHALGGSTGGRLPWSNAKSCPALQSWSARAPTRYFVDQVLKPKREN